MADEARAARSRGWRATGATAPTPSGSPTRSTPDMRAVMVVHNETSTGVTSRIADVRAALGDHDALLLVDTISSLAIDRLPPRRVGRRRHRRRLAEGPDAARRAELQRGLARRRSRPARARSCRARTGTGRRSSPPTRPATGRTRAPRTCSTGCARRSRCCARKGWRTSSPATPATPRRPAPPSHGWGLEVLALDEREFSGSLTAVLLDGSDEVRRVILERFDMSLGAGLGKLQDKVFRIGHLGDFNDLMLAGTLSRRADGAAASRATTSATASARRWSTSRSDGALDGVRVLELSQVMAGPFCGQVLADMGADVVKVEPPGSGDQTRVGDGGAAFRAVNRNKRSITLDLKDPGDVATLHRLVADRRRRDRELPPRRRGAARRRLRDAARAQPAADLRLDLRLRADRPVRAAARLRPDRPGRVGRDERHRRARTATRSSAACRSPTSPPACSARSASCRALHARERTRRGPADRHLAVGGRASRSRSGRPPSCGRRVRRRSRSAPRTALPRPIRRCARATAIRRRRQQPEAVAAAVRRDRARRSCSTTRASPTTPTAWRTAPSWSPSSRPRWPRATPRDWVDALLEAGVPAGPILDYAQVVDDPHTLRA